MTIPSFVGLGFEGTMVSVRPLKRGSGTITIRATDPSGLYAELEFSVTVKPPNEAPVLLVPIEDMALTVGGRSETVDLSSRFLDLERDELAYTVSSADPAVATAAVTDGALTVTAVAAGATTVTVAASDPGGLTSAPDLFAVTARSPVNVTIPDANLRAAVERELEKEAGATINSAEMEHLTRCDFAGMDIKSLEGLQFATGLISLDLYDNEVADLRPLSGLPSLTELVLFVNVVSDLTPLGGLRALTTLYLDDNLFTDLSPLSRLTDLTVLSLGGNSVTDYSPLSSLSNLAELSLRDNAMTDLTALTSLGSLRTLWLFRNCVTNVQALNRNTGLRAGDTVYLVGNALDRDTLAKDVPALRARGVTVLVSEAPTVRLGVPTHVVATPGDRQITVNWQAPAGVADIPVYELRWRSATGSFGGWAAMPCSSKRRHRIPGLANGTTYTVELRAAGHADNRVARVRATPGASSVPASGERSLQAALTAPGWVPRIVSGYGGTEVQAEGGWVLHLEDGTVRQPPLYLRELRVIEDPPADTEQVRVRLSTSAAAASPPPQGTFREQTTLACRARHWT
ncbi:MAG: fibronectin type III domain-containing protein [Acidobacteria bacterium]|nr:fibronectin type III domain-containing protein [Acidobacteriota bacterium]